MTKTKSEQIELDDVETPSPAENEGQAWARQYAASRAALAAASFDIYPVDQRTGQRVGVSAMGADREQQALRDKDAADERAARELIDSIRASVGSTDGVKPYGDLSGAVDMRKLDKLTRAELHRLAADIDNERGAIAERALKLLDLAFVREGSAMDTVADRAAATWPRF